MICYTKCNRLTIAHYKTPSTIKKPNPPLLPGFLPRVLSLGLLRPKKIHC